VHRSCGQRTQRDRVSRTEVAANGDGGRVA
jgi:hypothetical protein